MEQTGNRRLIVIASNGKSGEKAEGTSTVAFGWEEAREKAAEMRQQFPHWHVDIKEDEPDQDRTPFHGI